VNYFFDSSALMKPYHPELGSERVAAMFGGPDRRIVISRLAGVELHSALALKTRSESHYPAAERLIVQYGGRQGLRTLGALHLAVALEVQDRVGLHSFVAPPTGFFARLHLWKASPCLTQSRGNCRRAAGIRRHEETPAAQGHCR
jgi:hypothetical protein